MPVPAGTGLRRRLTRRDLVVYGLLFIGPLAPVGVFGVLDARTSGAVALVYVAATTAMAFTAWSYSEMSRVVPHAGSVFAYASRGLGPTAGFFAGWLAMLDYVLIPSVAYLFSGIALHALVPGVPAWVFTVLAFIATTALNFGGVSVAARAGTAVLVAELAVLAVFLAAGALVLWQAGPARPWLSPFSGLGGLDAADVVNAVSVAVLSFLGFDAIAAFAEESEGDARHVGQAIGWCLGAAGLAFVAQTWMAGVLSRMAPAALAAAPEAQGTAFYDVTRAAIGGWLATVVAVTKAVGPMFAAMTGQAAAARLVYGMARDGRLPGGLAEVDARAGVPRTALTATAAATLVVSVWAARQPDGLGTLVSIVDVGALAAFVMLHLSVVGFFAIRREAAAGAWHVSVPLLGVAVCGWVLVEASRLAQVVALVWAAAGIVVWAWGRRGAGAGPA
ncbi:MAG: APC family permease [Vicinamibacterales bacterium]